MLHDRPTSSSSELTPAWSSEAVHASSSSEIVAVPPLSYVSSTSISAFVVTTDDGCTRMIAVIVAEVAR